MENEDLILKHYYLANHNIISRGVSSSIEAVKDFISQGFPSSNAREGFLNYVKTLAVMFDSHHQTEDEIGFPYFEEQLFDTHFEWLHEDHDLLAGFLKELDPVVGSLAENAQTGENLMKLNEILLKIEDRWFQHIELEEEEYVNLIDALATYDERAKLIEHFFLYKEGLIKPYKLSIPFMIYNLAPEEREVISAGLRPEWLEKIESHEWKEELKAMQPFLAYK